jgi:hypothetical protein
MAKWFRSILILSLIFVFSAFLTSAQEDGGELSDGEEVEIEVDGEEELVFTYDADAGDVITVLVDANDDSDTVMTVFNPDGDEVARDDDNGRGTNPAIVRVELEEDGEYTLVLTMWSDDEELDDEFEVTLYLVDKLDLSDGPQTTVLGDDTEFDRMVFEAEEDVRYIVTVTTDDTLDSTLYIDIIEESDFFAGTRIQLMGTMGAFLFEASEDGEIVFELDMFSFSGDEYEITIEISEYEE